MRVSQKYKKSTYFDLGSLFCSCSCALTISRGLQSFNSQHDASNGMGFTCLQIDNFFLECRKNTNEMWMFECRRTNGPVAVCRHLVTYRYPIHLHHARPSIIFPCSGANWEDWRVALDDWCIWVQRTSANFPGSLFKDVESPMFSSNETAVAPVWTWSWKTIWLKWLHITTHHPSYATT